MTKKRVTYDKEFKEQVVQYMLAHPDTTYLDAGKMFGCHSTSVGDWMRQYKNNDNQVIVRGTGNFASDEAKEIARLKKELRDTQDALEVLKKAIGILGK